MKNSIFKSALLLFVLATITSCGNNDDNSAPDSRNVKYEITGNATGTFDATYSTGAQAANETPTSIPWSKELVFPAGFNTTSISSAVIGATPGQTITTKIYVGGVVKKQQSATVQANGTAIIPSLTYVLN